ncbi:hypothetical protein BU24DRAFT_477361 [Aaosphaeria arxii CBS 175.79]|uniref:Zn(2)-C6 fungal-type domain-containing protein n=1 Tax=Aaosphaeria arxii CBS 175.79 TaxID=1450172 RepID=A0A6A5Y5T9_9PLEO|nr:uncharacterized protein BU24DRAFT_477361 [Aaosphaeria arxii CBS 175.79]KAF2020211.1 hypothetical protein BU24DRAFT_477361 [Aaosphaeria arxii CBS 175.79]
MMNREGSDTTASRVWQACVNCRRKKHLTVMQIKCDGKDPCHNCSSRELLCDYPGSNDNASNSRSYVALHEARIQQLEELCQNLQVITTQLTQAIEKIPQGYSVNASCQHACNRGEIIHSHPYDNSGHLDTSPATGTIETSHGLPAETDPHEEAANSRAGSHQREDDVDGNGQAGSSTSPFGSLIQDSSGNSRFIGGASNEFLVQAIRSLTVAQSEGEAESLTFSIGSHHDSTMTTTAQQGFDLPFMTHDLRWRNLPYLPKPEDLKLPPKYIADMLVGLYFEHYHYSFPVLFKPHFIESYRQLYTTTREPAHDSGFLSVFFAVLACVSNLTSSEGPNSTYPGLEFYEKALLLYYSSNGKISKAQTQCLALLSMCCSGYNEASTSWHFAGQAVRSAQEQGFHMSELISIPDDPHKDASSSLDAELARRIWWAIYCLDRVTSISLGRPSAINDNDCSWELPLLISDEHLIDSHALENTPQDGLSSPTPLSGFIRFIRLCQISGQVHSIQAPSEVRDLGPRARRGRIMKLALDQERDLEDYAKELSDNLNDAFASRKNPFSQRQTITNCVTAARNCINSAILVRDFVPPSHLLALCVHYLIISGLVL